MSRSSSHSENISPTAFASGYFWYAQGLSHPAFNTHQGRLLHYLFRPFVLGTRVLGGFSMDALMLARHRGIDGVLARLIENGEVQQVIEVAAGMSPRGWDLVRRFGDRITYIETDLPKMAAFKRERLAGAGLLSDRHRVVELDALADSGPSSIFEVAATLDPALGTAIVTEGLMTYFDPDSARAAWNRFARVLRTFERGYYLSDHYMQHDYGRNLGAGMFRKVLSSFVKGRIHVHFDSDAQTVALMREAGFARVWIHDTASIPETRALAGKPGADRVRILQSQVARRRRNKPA